MCATTRQVSSSCRRCVRGNPTATRRSQAVLFLLSNFVVGGQEKMPGEWVEVPATGSGVDPAPEAQGYPRSDWPAPVFPAANRRLRLPATCFQERYNHHGHSNKCPSSRGTTKTESLKNITAASFQRPVHFRGVGQPTAQRESPKHRVASCNCCLTYTSGPGARFVPIGGKHFLLP